MSQTGYVEQRDRINEWT